MTATTRARIDSAAHANSYETRRQSVLTTVSVVYVHLWIIEGALRKWVPATDQVLYVARDAWIVLALLLVALTYPDKRRSHRRVIYWLVVWAFGIFACAQAVFVGSELPVLLVGLRNYIAPLLLIYVAWVHRPPQLLARIRKSLFLYAPAQAAIVVLQVLSPISSAINLSSRGEEAFTTADGIVRASGTFTFASGLTAYATITFALCMAQLIERENRLASGAVLVCCLIVIALGGSRGAVLASAIIAVALALQQVVQARMSRVAALVGAAVVAAVGWVAVSFLAPAVVDAFGTRFERAAASEDTVARLVGDTVGFFGQYIAAFGNGIGANSTAGISAGSGQLWIEDDSSRWVAELGLLGLVLATLRFGSGLILACWSISRVKVSSPTEMALTAVICPLLLYGAITTQPTAQGFFGIAVSCLIACGAAAGGDPRDIRVTPGTAELVGSGVVAATQRRRPSKAKPGS